jgi:hypothetical protein
VQQLATQADRPGPPPRAALHIFAVLTLSVALSPPRIIISVNVSLLATIIRIYASTESYPPCHASSTSLALSHPRQQPPLVPHSYSESHCESIELGRRSTGAACKKDSVGPSSTAKYQLPPQPPRVPTRIAPRPSFPSPFPLRAPPARSIHSKFSHVVLRQAHLVEKPKCRALGSSAKL